MKTAIIFYHISLSSSYNEKFFKDAQKIKIHILCLIVFFFQKNRTVSEKMRKNKLELDRPTMTIRRMRFACWMTKATNTHSEHVVHIPFP